MQFTLDKGDFSYRSIMWNNAELLHFMYDNMIADVAFQPKINVWRDEATVQLHAVSIKQELSLGDFRNSSINKWQLLTALGRVHNRLQVLVQNKLQAEALMDKQLTAYVKFVEYRDLKNIADFGNDSDVVVLLDFPPISLLEAVKTLRHSKTRMLYLLYKQQEGAFLLKELPVICPNREAMAVAYRKVMEEIAKPPLHLTWLLERYADCVSENAVKIMAELGFVALKDDIIEKNIIQRCQLENSPLYVQLQQQRQHLEAIYKENLRLSQHDLLRG